MWYGPVNSMGATLIGKAAAPSGFCELLDAWAGCCARAFGIVLDALLPEQPLKALAARRADTANMFVIERCLPKIFIGPPLVTIENQCNGAENTSL
jgi:hypothetical protein